MSSGPWESPDPRRVDPERVIWHVSGSRARVKYTDENGGIHTGVATLSELPTHGVAADGSLYPRNHPEETRGELMGLAWERMMNVLHQYRSGGSEIPLEQED